MMVINAERFGLAGLHQLRGRVGRGKEQSYCIFESNTKNKMTKERLNILKESNDGFYISEQDLKLRGQSLVVHYFEATNTLQRYKEVQVRQFSVLHILGFIITIRAKIQRPAHRFQ